MNNSIPTLYGAFFYMLLNRNTVNGKILKNNKYFRFKLVSIPYYNLSDSSKTLNKKNYLNVYL